MKKQLGFTLIELMIVVGIVGILSAIAYPSYRNHIVASHRAEAMVSLVSFQSAMERQYTANNNYCDAGGGGGANTCGGSANDSGTPNAAVFINAIPAPAVGVTSLYNLTINAVTASSFTLRATPIVGTIQATDGIIELDNTDLRRWDSDNSGAFSTTEQIWN